MEWPEVAFYPIRRIWYTALFQGFGKESGYFEGWYFKHVAQTGEVYAIIPGVALSGDGQKSAFIQTIDGSTAETHYVSYPYDEFSTSKDRFFVSIGSNTFHAGGLHIDLTDNDFHLRADLAYTDVKPMPFSLLNPNAMGWYSFVPFMECYHGLVSMDHTIQGEMAIEADRQKEDLTRIDFEGGRGYIEKDWGTSFPSSWVWMQTNAFSTVGTSFMLSIANIPWLGRHFIGFLGFLRHNGHFHRFATYTGARIESFHVSADGVSADIIAGRHVLSVEGRKQRQGTLQAPVHGVMQRRINESIDAEITLTMKTKDGTTIFTDTGRNGGLEIVGDVQELIDGVS